MILTLSWLKNHLSTKASINEITEKLTNIGLEVEGIKEGSGNLSEFKIAKILKTEKHPNADKLKLCDVTIGESSVIKVVCGAENARDGLVTVYAPPGATIPKSKMKLKIAKIRGVESRGMLCSESELNLSEESAGIIELKNMSNKIGKNFFKSSNEKVIDLSITPNRPDCLGIRGIARDLAAAGMGKLLDLKKNKINQKKNQNIKISITKEKNQGCLAFGSCLITGIKNQESPKWLKDKIYSLGLKPISAVVDITNYVMFDLNRPLHAYDADKIDKEIIVRNSKKGESFTALDDKKYTLQKDMCVIADKSGVLGLGGIIGGTRSGTGIETQNILLESAYFLPSSIRKTSKQLGLETDAKYRFERGIDPNSMIDGLKIATDLILKICGGEASKFNISGKKEYKNQLIDLEVGKFKNTIGIAITESEIKKILNSLGFLTKSKKKILKVLVPTWRPDIGQEIDLIEELIRIKGFDKINLIEPEKIRNKETLNFQQKLFHLGQRSISNKGYYEAVTWSFTDQKIDDLISDSTNPILIINPISKELNVLRKSIFSNLLFYLKKNHDRGFQDISLFEIGPVFYGKKPGEQQTVIGAVKSGQINKKSWSEKTRNVDIFDMKTDVIKTLIEMGINEDHLIVSDKSKNCYHPGRSGSVNLKTNNGVLLAQFGEIHPSIISKLDYKEKNIYGLEIFLDNIPKPINKLRVLKENFKFSDFQISERDFAFVVDKNYQVGKLNKVIKDIDINIRSVNIFDVFEGGNLPPNKKSIAINVSIQAEDRTLSDGDLNQISKKIIQEVENKTGGNIRS
jgi:phenylalanyl-tRNA synthetase beta chain